MAGKIASFVSGGLLVIRIGKMQFAYCQSLSFNQNMNLTPVGGIGSFGFSALEPTGFSASGSIRIVRWDSRLKKAIAAATGTAPGAVSPAFPENLDATADSLPNQGNSLLDTNAFNPLGLLLSSTFDIDVYERGAGLITNKDTGVAGIDLLTEKPLFKFIDCRFTDYSFDFSPGQLLYENANYVCSNIQEFFE